MGCIPSDDACLGNELPRHSVKLSKGFWIGQTPVTQSAYEKVMGTNPSKFRGDLLPVENVSWDEANAFCLSVGMRLPTEAEWEWASRGGMEIARYGQLGEIAWYRGNSSGRTHQVALKEPSGYGLYDMLGNVWEWVADWYAEYPVARNGPRCCDNPDPAVLDPKGPPTGRYCVLRGGSWNDFSADVRMSLRDHLTSSPDEGDRDYDNYSIGFRCAGDLP
jgi:formylglycine-generating enzyme required for sulfatase activity